MDKIKWCLKAKNGFELVEPNENLTNAYLKKAENSLKATLALKGIKDWEISSSYYAMYFSLYAILMKIGIKCEIHSCSINFMRYFLSKYFKEEEINLVERSQKARIDTQYYSNRNISNELYEKIINNASLFFIRCKEVLNNLDENSIQEIRKIIQKY